MSAVVVAVPRYDVVLFCYVSCNIIKSLVYLCNEVIDYRIVHDYGIGEAAVQDVSKPIAAAFSKYFCYFVGRTGLVKVIDEVENRLHYSAVLFSLRFTGTRMSLFVNNAYKPSGTVKNANVRSCRATISNTVTARIARPSNF